VYNFLIQDVHHERQKVVELLVAQEPSTGRVKVMPTRKVVGRVERGKEVEEGTGLNEPLG
jgi:hypothetical protein